MSPSARAARLALIARMQSERTLIGLARAGAEIRRTEAELAEVRAARIRACCDAARSGSTQDRSQAEKFGNWTMAQQAQLQIRLAAEKARWLSAAEAARHAHGRFEALERIEAELRDASAALTVRRGGG